MFCKVIVIFGTIGRLLINVRMIERKDINNNEDESIMTIRRRLIIISDRIEEVGYL